MQIDSHFFVKSEKLQECIDILGKVNSTAEYAIIFDMCGYMNDPDVPQVLKQLRKNIK